MKIILMLALTIGIMTVVRADQNSNNQQVENSIDILIRQYQQNQNLQGFGWTMNGNIKAQILLYKNALAGINWSGPTDWTNVQMVNWAQFNK